MLRRIEHRNHYAEKGLAHANFFFFAQAQHQAGHALGEGHTALQITVDQAVIRFGEAAPVHRTGRTVEVAVKLLRKKRRKGSNESRHGIEAFVQGLKGCQLVVAHGSLPEPAAAEAHVPIT